MSMDVLNQDEIDALIDSSDKEDKAKVKSDEPITYDFTSLDHINRGRLPTLEMVNERFSRKMQVIIFNLFKKNVEFNFSDIKICKFSDYSKTLFTPSAINLVKLKPLEGVALVVLNEDLLFMLVDLYFGGKGAKNDKKVSREFSSSELRINNIIMDIIKEEYSKAFKTITNIIMEKKGFETNPNHASVLAPSESVLVSSFKLNYEESDCEFCIVIPNSMVEPFRDVLYSSTQGETESVDQKWEKSLKTEIMTVNVDVGSSILNKKVKLKDVYNFKVGDIIPVDLPPRVILEANSIPLFSCSFGKSNGHYALKIEKFLTSN